ncbi:hypothetical protein IJ596_06000 [bacterium]|nr:hypothetical protein [bacterium]
MDIRVNNYDKQSFGNTLCIIKPGQYDKSKSIIDNYIIPAGFKIVKKWEGVAPKEVLEKHYSDIANKPFYKDVIDYMNSGKITVLELNGGEGDVSKFEQLTTNLLRPIFGTDKIHNAIYASDSIESANREINEIWGKYLNLQA